MRETLQWLDEATTKHPNAVTLQGADETYERWTEVERFAVPRTLFSEHDHDVDNEIESSQLSEDTINKLTLSDSHVKPSHSSVASDMSGAFSPSSQRSVRSSASPVSPPTSPAKPAAPLPQDMTSASTQQSRPQSSSASVPQSLKPLLNYILWRVHQETDPVAALESFIFLCNDSRKVGHAKGFDIKTKRLEQLREAIGREDRDFKARQALLNRENQTVTSTAEAEDEMQDEDMEEEDEEEKVVFKPHPPKAPAAMLQKPQTNVIDPNAFGRGPPPMATAAQQISNGAPNSPRGSHVVPSRGSPRGNHALPFAPRGNMRGVARGNFRGGPRGRGSSGAGRGGYAHKDATGNATLSGQIDPNSFSRPDPRGGLSSSRGGRRLWVPT